MHFEMIDKDQRTMRINGTLMSIDTMKKAIVWFHAQTDYKDYISEVIDNCYNSEDNIVIDINKVPEEKLVEISMKFVNMRNDKETAALYEFDEDIMRECIEEVLNVDVIWNRAYSNDGELNLPF